MTDNISSAKEVMVLDPRLLQFSLEQAQRGCIVVDVPDDGSLVFKVAIFATAHTVQTGAYVTEITLRAPQIQVVQKACPDLVSMIEGNAPHSAIRSVVRCYVQELLETDGFPDVCVLGCTHYPLIEDHFVAELPASVTLLSQADVTARSLAAYLQRHPRHSTIGASSREFLTTGGATQVSALATRFYGRSVRFAGLTGADELAT